jgi:hypothetical protein
MKINLIVNPELAQLAQQEIKEILTLDATISGDILEIEATAEQLKTLIEKCQSARRIIINIATISNLDNITFNNLELFETAKSLRLTVEHLKGQDNRIKLAKQIAIQLFAKLKENNLDLELDLKKPDINVIVYHQEGQYYLGLDQAGEMNIREYRLFPHSATFKGDISYYIVRFSDFKPGSELLIGYSKDGSLAIEAARYSGMEIKAFDESRQNITAARKNTTIANVKANYQRYSLEELDTRFDKEQFNQVIYHITKKDERHLNELYYQSKYILKQGGIVILITRPTWDLSVSDSFILIEKKELPVGQSSHMLWKLKKK